ncbi:hypothetical protein EWM62_04965 [Mucilaginibacter terrigena]|uniref:Uncharacterized protein n=1 Tax=Mucilaginibacter terrigena TaxID=2492395 RepID=A0A4Q5LPI2_9SPHI|nr:hypothetical protein [Mucilaginibacter terrigena]RYU91292.1 hypothetical protein EWM62_04965 [Mucilaginibacter terrigena]
MESYQVAITKDTKTHRFEIGEYPHHKDGSCKYRVFENGVYVASIEPDTHHLLHICQNPGHIAEDILHLLADKIEASHPRNIGDEDVE